MFETSMLPADQIVRELKQNDVFSLPILRDSFRLELLAEAENADFRAARQSIGEGERIVYQRMEVCDRFPEESGFFALRDGFQSLWNASFSVAREQPFESTVEFNDLMLQRYPVGDLGITPHRDRTGYRNVICLFVLAGRGRFCICDNRGGGNARAIRNDPGDVILTRAPGFLGSSARPFHFVSDITERRYVFGLRQERD